MNLKQLLFITIFISSCFISIAQKRVQYLIPGMKNYFSNYRNGLNVDNLNDSITSSFFKVNDNTFKIKFFIKDKFVKECSCKYQGKYETKTANELSASSDGSTKFIKIKYVVRYLNLTNKNCLDFLPKNLFSK